MDEINGFDLHAAWIRRAQVDLHAFLEALAVRLEQALPGRVQVERKRDGLFKSTSHVVSVAVHTDNGAYLLDAHTPTIQTKRQHEVRGVVLRNETLPLDEWLKALEKELHELSGTLTGARTVLQDFLTS